MPLPNDCSFITIRLEYLRKSELLTIKIAPVNILVKPIFMRILSC